MISIWAKKQIKDSYKYYYGVLSRPERVVYKQLLLAMAEFKTSCDISERLDVDAYSRVYNYLLLDNPALFFVENIAFFYIARRTTARISYTYSREKASEISNRLDRRIEQIAATCSNACDLAKEKRVHDFLVKNVVYDDKFNGEIHSAHTALLKSRAVCDGFSKAAKLIFDRISVKSIIITGTSDVQYPSSGNHTDGHSWNMVNIDGLFYHLDVTFDTNLTSGRSIRYDYFNLSDDQIRRDHTFDLLDQITVCTSPNDYYTNHGLYFNSKKRLQSALRDTLQKKKTEFTFRLPFTQDPEKTLGEISNLVHLIIQTESGCAFRKYSISTNQQQMIMHLQFDV